MSDQIQIVRLIGYLPGALGRITELHGSAYAAECGLGLAYEATVAHGVADFMVRADPHRDGLWLALNNEYVIGAIALDTAGPEAPEVMLRWFIVDPTWRGHGIGGRLLDEALAFARNCAYRRVVLWGYEGHASRRALVEKHGFRIDDRRPHEEASGRQLTLEKWVWESGAGIA